MLELVNEMNKQGAMENLNKEQLYKKILGKLAEIFESLQDNKTNDSFVNLAELILISNKLLEGEL